MEYSTDGLYILLSGFFSTILYSDKVPKVYPGFLRQRLPRIESAGP